MNLWNPTLFLSQGKAKNYSQPYLEKLVESGRKLRASNLPVIFSLSHLANLSDTQYSDLHSFVSRTTTKKDFPYKNFTITKRSGGIRWISVPCPALMAVQKWISQNILNNIPPHPSSFAYAKNRGIKGHAERHCSAKWILKIDLKDFFNNISELQVYYLFRNLGYPDLLAFEMSRICTRITRRRKGKRWKNEDYNPDIPYDSEFIGSLPQGAPTSPAISNLIFLEIDKQLESLALQLGATYSRYADDLCFSFTESTREELLSYKQAISKILYSHGFRTNKKKTRIIPPGSRKIITGLVVNEDIPSTPKALRDKVRMHCYYAKKWGIPQHCDKIGFRSIIGFRNHLFGLITYIHSINPQQASKLSKQFHDLPWIKFEI